MKPIEPHQTRTETCAYCPSLCLHVCPVSTVEARDTVSPWGKVSLIHHQLEGNVSPTELTAAIAYKCTSCGACTSWCRHSIDVAGILQAARTNAIASGHEPFKVELFERNDVSLRSKVFREAVKCQRYHEFPPVLLFPGHTVLRESPDILSELWGTLNRLEDDELVLGKASSLDSGYMLWTGGYVNAFRQHAERLVPLLSQAGTLVVLSPQDLHMFKNVYPQFGFQLDVTLFDLTSYVLPMLSGASVDRQTGSIGYFDSCHLARHCSITDSPRQVLKRITATPPTELALCRDATDCCGAGGGFSKTSKKSAEAAARRIIMQAEESGIDRLLCFSPECVSLLQGVAPSGLAVEHGITLLNEALRRSP